MQGEAAHVGPPQLVIRNEVSGKRITAAARRTTLTPGDRPYTSGLFCFLLLEIHFLNHASIISLICSESPLYHLLGLQNNDLAAAVAAFDEALSLLRVRQVRGRRLT